MNVLINCCSGLASNFKDASDAAAAITRHRTSKASWLQEQQWVSFTDIRFAKFGGGGKTGRHVLLRLRSYLVVITPPTWSASVDPPVVGVLYIMLVVKHINLLMGAEMRLLTTKQAVK